MLSESHPESHPDRDGITLESPRNHPGTGPGEPTSTLRKGNAREQQRPGAPMPGGNNAWEQQRPGATMPRSNNAQEQQCPGTTTTF